MRALVDQTWSDELLAAIVNEPVPASAAQKRQRSPLRAVIVVGLATAVLAAPAYALGRTVVDWIIGEPAPPEVVEDFGNYAPQLGFDPQPGKATLVAVDGDLRLYVTTNKQGTYCFALNTRRDGGTCVPKAVSKAPIVAGFAGNAPAPDGSSRLTVVGRVKEPAARAVRFMAPDGTPVAARVGAGGFFVAAVPMASEGSPCANGDWAPTFTFSSADGAVLTEAAITIGTARGTGAAAVCMLPSLHGP